MHIAQLRVWTLKSCCGRNLQRSGSSGTQSPWEGSGLSGSKTG
uniref:Uncharacterized protein n=1 Tax=Rhizophora mucronata TaxID=61149 RepID=A0A2P2IXP2_RHIMU